MSPSPEPRTINVPVRTHGRVLVRDRADAVGLLAGFHGYAEDAGTQLQRLVEIPGSDRWILVSIQGLHRFYRGRSQETVAGWMTRQDRELAIADNVEYVDRALTDVLNAMAEGHPAGKPAGGLPLVLAGFSQGVAMAFRSAVRGEQPAHGIIAVGGDVPPELVADGTATFPHVLLVRGNRDEWYTAEKLEADRAALSGRARSVQAVTADAGHEWTPEIAGAAGTFLKRFAP